MAFKALKKTKTFFLIKIGTGGLADIEVFGRLQKRNRLTLKLGIVFISFANIKKWSGILLHHTEIT